MSAEDLTPPYWINMGAVAISTLAGARLLSQSALSPIVGDLTSFVAGLTLFFWAIGTWWIPMLVALGRSEEHTSELQSLMRISYAVFCLKKKTNMYLEKLDVLEQ